MQAWLSAVACICCYMPNLRGYRSPAARGGVSDFFKPQGFYLDRVDCGTDGKREVDLGMAIPQQVVYRVIVVFILFDY